MLWLDLCGRRIHLRYIYNVIDRRGAFQTKPKWWRGLCLVAVGNCLLGFRALLAVSFLPPFSMRQLWFNSPECGHVSGRMHTWAAPLCFFCTFCVCKISSFLWLQPDVSGRSYVRTLLPGAAACCPRLWAFVCFFEVYLLTRFLFGACQAYRGADPFLLARSPLPVCILFHVVAGAMGVCLSII